jgi:hypothetical protein
VGAEGIAVRPRHPGGNESHFITGVDKSIEGTDEVVYEHTLDFIQRQVKFVGQVEPRTALRGGLHWVPVHACDGWYAANRTCELWCWVSNPWGKPFRL